MGRKTGSQRREDQQNRREDQQKKRTAKVIENRKKAIWSRSGVPDQTNRTWRVDDDENRELQIKSGVDPTKFYVHGDKNNKSSNTSSITTNIKKPIWARGGILRYPLEAMTDSTDYLQIDIGKYIPVKTDKDSFYVGAHGSRRAKRKSDVPGGLSNHSLVNKGTVLLQIPANIQDGNSTSYGDSKMNTIVGAAVGGAEGFMTGVGDALKNPPEGKSALEAARDKSAEVLKRTFSATGVGGEQLRNLITKKLLSSLDYPLAAPSANIYTQLSPISKKDVKEEFGKKINLI